MNTDSPRIILADSGHLEESGYCLDYSPLEKLGLFISLNIKQDQLVEAARDANVIIIGKLELRDEMIQALPKLRLIVKAGTGVDNIDLEAARRQGVIVCNLVGYGNYVVAQGTLALILALAGNIAPYDAAVKNGLWQQSQYRLPVQDLQGKTLAILGLGSISRGLIKMVAGLDMQLIAHTRHPDSSLPVRYVSREELASQADILSVHCTLRPDTRGLIDSHFFKLMKPTSLLINTARAEVIDEKALIEALQNKQIAGAALDGWWKEPAPSTHPLYELPNMLITPHITWSAGTTRQRMVNELAKVVQAYLLGAPINQV